MKALILTLITTLAIPTIVMSSQSSQSSQSSSFDHANQLAADGQWTEAIASYNKSLASDSPSAATLYNLGNAHYAAGDKGRAILAWERAKLAAPGDADISNNLSIARSETGTAEPAPPAWKAPIFWISVNGWATAGSLALAALAVIVLSSASGLKFRGKRSLGLATTSIAILSVVLISLRAKESTRAIIVESNGAPVRISPFENAQQLTTLPPGTPVYMLRTHGNFDQVITTDGRKGWIRDTAIETVIDVASHKSGNDILASISLSAHQGNERHRDKQEPLPRCLQAVA